jgi:peptidoglycan hydrolase CwlO-like protein
MHQKNKYHFSVRSLVSFRNLRGLGITVAAAACLVTIPFVHADDYQQQIETLNTQSSQAQTVLNSLQTQATTLQGEISLLQSQINAIQTSINANEAKQIQLQDTIKTDQAKIAQNKSFLADDLKTMYIDGQMSTIEELATSQNLSDYVDKEEYRTVVQDKITDLLNQIQTLEAQSQEQKEQVSALLQTEQNQESTVATDQSAENQLLSANQGQQNQYDQLINSNNSEVSALRQAQAAANASVAGSLNIKASGGSGGACDIGQGNGGYPFNWCNVTQDSINDAYGFPVRECTSFANWYFINEEGQSDFKVSGNAGWWYLTSNYAATTYPDVKVGALGIEPSSSLNAPVPSLHGGYYGHVMVVLALPGTTYEGSLPGTSAARGTYVPSGDVLVMSMNEDENGHFMYNLWPDDYLMYLNPQ